MVSSLWTSPHVNFLERMCLKAVCEIVTPSLESLSLVSPPSVSGLYNAVPLVDNTMISLYCVIYLLRMGLQALLLTMDFIMLVTNVDAHPNLESCIP